MGDCGRRANQNGTQAPADFEPEPADFEPEPADFEPATDSRPSAVRQQTTCCRPAHGLLRILDPIQCL